MRAVLVGEGKGAQKLYIGDAPTPVPGPDEVLVQASTIAVLCRHPLTVDLDQSFRNQPNGGVLIFSEYQRRF